MAALLAAATLLASAAGSPFPLAGGNHWTLRDAQTSARADVAVERRASGLVLTGFPGAGDLRVRARGGAVQAWDPVQRRWEPFLRLGASAGTRYAVRLGRTALWRNVVVTVASRNAVAPDAADRIHRGCIRLAVRSKAPIADAGVEELVFAPRVGPVRVTETTIAGPRTLLLSGYRAR